MINRILVPTDGSECSYKALDWALDLAEKYGAEVELLCVIPTTAFAVIGPCERELQDHAEKILGEALDKSKSKPGLRISSKILVGSPADKIVEESKEGNFDLIVMGSRGLGGIKGFLLGSVADRVADLAQCPVIVVK
ncbi:universal stress protein [Candidatus Bathyarchaeota archaeon]|nr:universal stress protein [Candidatus Bathyarchaeota archaeon]